MKYEMKEEIYFIEKRSQNKIQYLSFNDWQ